jgi:hypothetical protein
MQGGGNWYTAGLLFTNDNVDIALIQECGQPPDSEVEKDQGDVQIYNWAGRRVYHMTYGSGNSRCSTAVVLSEDIKGKASSWKFFDPPSAQPESRRLLCVNVANTWYCSIHAPAHSGPASLSYIDHMLSKCHENFGFFVCGGDYNKETHELHVGSKLKASPPSRVTHINGGEIDYVVTKGVVYTCKEVGRVGNSDHAWTIFEA